MLATTWYKVAPYRVLPWVDCSWDLCEQDSTRYSMYYAAGTVSFVHNQIGGDPVMVHIYGHHSNLSIGLKRKQSQNRFRALYDGDVVQLIDILPIL